MVLLASITFADEFQLVVEDLSQRQNYGGCTEDSTSNSEYHTTQDLYVLTMMKLYRRTAVLFSVLAVVFIHAPIVRSLPASEAVKCDTLSAVGSPDDAVFVAKKYLINRATGERVSIYCKWFTEASQDAKGMWEDKRYFAAYIVLDGVEYLAGKDGWFCSGGDCVRF